MYEVSLSRYHISITWYQQINVSSVAPLAKVHIVQFHNIDPTRDVSVAVDTRLTSSVSANPRTMQACAQDIVPQEIAFVCLARYGLH